MAIIHYHRRDLPHFQRDDTQHFLTFCTADRIVLPPVARTIVLRCCTYEHERRAHVYAAVVMPDHVHLVLSALLNGDAPVTLSAITHTIKSASAHSVNRLLNRAGAVWQKETFDHCIRSGESLNAKIAYVINNPVRRGLARRARAYRWLWTSDPDFVDKFLLDGLD